MLLVQRQDQVLHYHRRTYYKYSTGTARGKCHPSNCTIAAPLLRICCVVTVPGQPVGACTRADVRMEWCAQWCSPRTNIISMLIKQHSSTATALLQCWRQCSGSAIVTLALWGPLHYRHQQQLYYPGCPGFPVCVGCPSCLGCPGCLEAWIALGL